MKSYYEDIRDIILKNSSAQLRVFSEPVQPLALPFSGVKEQEFEPQESPIEKTPKLTDVTAENSHFSICKTSFSGADMCVMLDNEILGELQSIEWYKPHDRIIENLAESNYIDSELAMEYPVVIIANFAIFDRDPLTNLDNGNIIINYVNEYGRAAYRAIYDVIPINEISGCSVDSVITENVMLLAAKEVTELKEGVNYKDGQEVKITFNKQ